MKKYLFILIGFLIALPVFATTNTKSLDFELDNSQYLKITDISQTGLDPTGDISIEMWIKLEHLPNPSEDKSSPLVSKDVGDQSGYHIFISPLAEPKLNFIFYSGVWPGHYTRGYCDTAFTESDVGVWKHIAVVADVSTDTITFYFDGIAQTTTYTYRNAHAIADNNGDFTIGKNGEAVNYFDGKIDEVRVWNDIRSGSEIANNYQIELVGNEAGLVGYWKLNNSFSDETANNNDLTAVNSPAFSTDLPFSGIIQHTLTTSGTNGTITPDCTGGCLYDENTEVELTAHASGGYHFDYWTGGLTGSDNPDTITMTADKNVVAHFAENEAPPAVSGHLFSVPMASSSEMLASTGVLGMDLWTIIALAMGIPLAFYVIKGFITFTPKAYAKWKEQHPD